MKKPETNNGNSNHIVTIHVNEKPIEVLGPKTTGGDIKNAAIEQGLSIQTDFVLSEERPNGDTKIIGNNDPVTINPQSRFIALAPDDNS